MNWSNSKYKAVKTTVDGITFDSKKEAKRYTELKLLEKAGMITHLELQPTYEIIINGVKVCSYRPDFRYFTVRAEEREHTKFQRRMDSANQERDPEGQIVEDVKGYKTPLYRLKKKSSRGILSRHADQGTITLGQFMHFFDKVSPMPLHDFAHHKKARAEHLAVSCLVYSHSPEDWAGSH